MNTKLLEFVLQSGMYYSKDSYGTYIELPDSGDSVAAIEHFAELVAAEERARIVKMLSESKTKHKTISDKQAYKIAQFHNLQPQEFYAIYDDIMQTIK
jgi:hypothetical protein